MPFDLTSSHSDGANLFAAYRGNAIGLSDPLGLMSADEIAATFLLSVSSAAGDLLDLLDGYNLLIRTARLVDEATLQQQMDVDWALDWNADDDQYLSDRVGTPVIVGAEASIPSGPGDISAYGRPKRVINDLPIRGRYHNLWHGVATTHAEDLRRVIRKWKNYHQDHNVRMNQTLVDWNNRPLVNRRPDILIRDDRNSKYIIIQFDYSASSARANDDMSAALDRAGINHEILVLRDHAAAMRFLRSIR